MTNRRSATVWRVLLVEDEWLIVNQIEAALRDTNFEIVARAATLADAGQLAGSASFEIAILDGNLDGEDTTALARRISSLGVPVLMVTAYGQPGYSLPSSRMGVIAKPFSGNGLLTALDRLINDQNALDRRSPTG